MKRLKVVGIIEVIQSDKPARFISDQLEEPDILASLIVIRENVGIIASQSTIL